MIGRSSPSRPSRLDRQAYKWVMRMLDDPAANAAGLERWLSKDPERREVYKRVAIEVGYASDAAAEMPLLRAAALRDAPRSKRKQPSFWIATGLTAAIAVIALLGWRIMTDAQHANTRPAAVATLATQDGSKTFRLADGSMITLYGSSDVRVRYSSIERAIDLESGLARFAVAHDPARPFNVYVKGGKVTAVGTEFEIDTRSGVLVQLFKGRVVVTLPQQRAGMVGRQVTLDPGQRIAFAEEEKVSMSTQPGQHATSAAPVRSYDDVTVGDIVAEVNARSKTKIVIADASIEREKIFAELNVSDPEAVARKLAIILDLSLEHLGADELRLARKH